MAGGCLTIKFVRIHHNPTSGWGRAQELRQSIRRYGKLPVVFSPGVAPMKEISRLRKLEADCRQRAQSEPERKWYWLAQAARYRMQANLEVTENAGEPNVPEVKLASWPIGGDQRRLH